MSKSPAILFEGDSHSYKVDGAAVPSVTEVLTSVLGPHPASAHTTEYHLMRGQVAHAIYAIAGSVAAGGKSPDQVRTEIEAGWTLDTAMQVYLDGWLAWYAVFPGTIIECEKRVASIVYGYAGTLDLLVKDAKGRLGIIDFKQSHSGRDRYQMAAYALAYNEHHQEKVSWIQPVQITGLNYTMHKALTAQSYRMAVLSWQSIIAVYRMIKRGD